MSTRNIAKVAIVGRTNVGKSTLFNALAGRRLAIVKDTPGVTRDRFETIVNRLGISFQLIDTGGLIGEEDTELHAAVRTQARVAIEEADLILAVFDGLSGMHAADKEIAQLLRRSGKPVLYVINKCEKPATRVEAAEFYGLGIEELLPISAAHNEGISELLQQVREALGSRAEAPSDAAAENIIRVAIVGRPNVGKSTLVNKVCGADRMITSDIPGTTRDSVDIPLTREGQRFVLVDTAGLRKKARVSDQSVERYSNLRTLRSVVQADVVVLLLDATQGAPGEQDLKIGGVIHDRGRPFLIAVNKWDAIEKDHRTAKQYKDAVEKAFRFAPYAPVLFVSALTGTRCPKILAKVKELYEVSRTRIQTAKVNEVLNRAFRRKPPPVHRGEPLKLYFATQIGVAPPTFVLFVNNPKKLHFSYQRYLKNALRDEFPLQGTNIKFVIRKRSEKEEREAGREV